VIAVFLISIASLFALKLVTRTPPETVFAQTSPFAATPLTNFVPGQLYLGKFPGLLYSGSNNPPADHDADGRKFASKIVPINGKIVVIGIGMSNWTIELCTGRDPIKVPCTSNSFLARAAADPNVNHADLVLVDCAQGGHDARRWVDDTFGSYTTCDSRLAALGLRPDQVEGVLWKDGNEFPTVSLSSSTVCSPTSAVDACKYELYMGEMARYVKRQRYPNTQELLLHTRIYAGYALSTLNPEPFAYEYGFATKWLVDAQIRQIRTGKIDPTAGDLSYQAAPWIAWGPYFWASGATPRSDGLAWLVSDYSPGDLTHPGPGGVTKVADQMMLWYLSSPYTPWFRASGQ
jgi:hypothetical protein